MLKRFLLWDYPRASLQYDLMVALILAFIFLVPRSVFQDQPRTRSIVQLPVTDGPKLYWLEPELLTSIPEAQRPSRVQSLVQSRFGKREQVVGIDTVKGLEGDIKGYTARTLP